MHGTSRTLVVLFALFSPALALTQQQPPPTVDCSLESGHYTCTRSVLLHRFAEAHTVAIATEPRSRMAQAQLTHFIESLDKQVVPDGQQADITLHLVRAPSDGVEVGPSDMDLATLRVFWSRHGNDRSHLIWVETYRGQVDRPWPAVVNGLTSQFQKTLSGR